MNLQIVILIYCKIDISNNIDKITIRVIFFIKLLK